ncbi:hypothetical protein KC957_00230 [Candidatus Saccharibacteria bacterium]|nr:hypothetical protein [Candidatus Saccharibacteria bacterium]
MTEFVGQTESFRLARRVGSKQRKLFKGIKPIGELARLGGASFLAFPANTSIDIVDAAEMAPILAAFPELDEAEIDREFENGKEARRSTMPSYREFRLAGPDVEFYDAVDGSVNLGIPLDEEGHQIIAEERRVAGAVLSSLIGETIQFSPRPSSLTIANVRTDNDVVLNVLADVAEDRLWPNGWAANPALHKVFTYNVGVQIVG